MQGLAKLVQVGKGKIQWCTHTADKYLQWSCTCTHARARAHTHTHTHTHTHIHYCKLLGIGDTYWLIGLFRMLCLSSTKKWLVRGKQPPYHEQVPDRSLSLSPPPLPPPSPLPLLLPSLLTLTGSKLSLHNSTAAIQPTK